MTRVPHANRGMGLEAALDLAHDLYWMRQRVKVDHYGVSGKFRNAKGGARLVAFPKHRQPPDYHGCIGGRMVVFDAKEARPAKAARPRKSWRLDNRYSHQYDRLRDWATAGALAFFAVLDVQRDLLHLLRIRPDSPWPGVALGEAAPDVLLVHPNSENFFDWLAAVQVAGWL